jgi:Na+/glutamate symporter
MTLVKQRYLKRLQFSNNIKNIYFAIYFANISLENKINYFIEIKKHCVMLLSGAGGLSLTINMFENYCILVFKCQRGLL